jgi:hypothetical protein
VPHSPRIKVEKKDLNYGKFSMWIGKSVTQTGQVRWTFSATTFDHGFERNLLTVSLIDPIILLLAL